MQTLHLYHTLKQDDLLLFFPNYVFAWSLPTTTSTLYSHVQWFQGTFNPCSCITHQLENLLLFISDCGQLFLGTHCSYMKKDVRTNLESLRLLSFFLFYYTTLIYFWWSEIKGRRLTVLLANSFMIRNLKKKDMLKNLNYWQSRPLAIESQEVELYVSFLFYIQTVVVFDNSIGFLW